MSKPTLTLVILLLIAQAHLSQAAVILKRESISEPKSDLQMTQLRRSSAYDHLQEKFNNAQKLTLNLKSLTEPLQESQPSIPQSFSLSEQRKPSPLKPRNLQSSPETKLQNTLPIQPTSQNDNTTLLTVAQPPCSIKNCKSCTSYSSLNSDFALKANDLYPANDHPQYAQEFCNVCDSGFFLYRHQLVVKALQTFIDSSYQNMDELFALLGTALDEQQACVPIKQKVLEASIRISKLNLDSYLDEPDFFKPWIVSVMKKYQIQEQNLRLIFAQKGSLILKYWFSVDSTFTPDGNVTDDVFHSGIDQIYEGSEVTDFGIDEIVSPDPQPIIDPQPNPIVEPEPTPVDNTPKNQEPIHQAPKEDQPTMNLTESNSNQVNSSSLVEPLPPSQSSGPNMIVLIVVGVTSALLLLVAAVYMLCIRKKTEQEEEENNEVKTEKIKEGSKPSILLIKDSVSQQETQHTTHPNLKQTSILKQNSSSIITSESQLPKQESIIQRLLAFIERKPVNPKQQKKSSDQVESMEDLVRQKAQSNKPLGEVPQFI